MAEVAARSSGHRGRGSTRAGRGGHSSRGGRSSARAANGDALSSNAAVQEPSLEEQGELGQLKKQYLPQINTLKELFPDWTDDDLVFALQESDGDLQTTIEKITEGNVSQFSDVKKKTREKSRPKISEATGTGSDKTATGGSRSRGRGGSEAGRGGRGRGTERGNRTGRGGRAVSTSTARAADATSAPTAVETGSWDNAAKAEILEDVKPATPDLPASDGQWSSAVVPEVQSAATEVRKTSSIIPGGQKKSWASMLAQPKAPPAMPKPAAPPATASAPVPTISESGPAASVTEEKLAATTIPLQDPVTAEHLRPPTSESVMTPATERQPSETASINLTPPRDKLTEDNLEHIPDASRPAPTETAASTLDPSSVVGSATPTLSQVGTHGTPVATRPPVGGFATSAWKATAMSGRSASYNRRILEQQEAVVMPGSSHAVDRAAVQFGSLGLGGDNTRPLDVDDDREEPETRAQPPQQSPSAPRASLPPAAPSVQLTQEPQLTDEITTPKPPAGFAAPTQQPLAPTTSQIPSSTHTGAPGLQSNQAYSQQQYGRYGSAGVGQDNIAHQQKAYDPFSQQLTGHASSQAEQSSLYATSQNSSSLPQPTQSHLGGIGGSQNEYSSPMGSEPTRAQQSYYGGSYTQGGAPGLVQDQAQAPQRSTSGFGGADSAYGATHATQTRFGESQHSGNNTPNPTAQVSSHAPQHQQHQMQSQQHHGQGGWGGGYGGYPYSYNNPQYNQYMNQYGNAYGAYGQQYGGQPYGGKGYGHQQHHGYGMPSHSSYEHSSSPANVGGYGSSLRGSESGFSGGLGDYNRSSSTQPSLNQHSSSASGLGGVGDTYGRSPSGLGHQNQTYGQQSAAQGEESMKAYAEPKTGPSPSLGQSGRTGSALGNSSQYSGQSGFPPPATHQGQQGQQGQQGFQSHLNQYGAGGYGGLGGIGGHQGSGQGQGSGFSGYGGFSNSNSYGGNYGGRGWGSNYGQGSGYSHH